MENKKIKVLVLLATYNGAKYLNDQVNSILNQVDIDIDILISDDESTDETIIILNKFKFDHKNIKVIKNKIKTSSHSGNFYNLILQSKPNKYDFIAYSDQDDKFHPYKYLKSAEHIIKSNVDGISSSVRCFNGSKNILKQSKNITKYDFLFEGAGQGCTFLIRSDIFLSFKKYVENNINLVQNFFFHDWLTYLYIRSMKKKWMFLSEIYTDYRIHSDNTIGNKFSVSGAIDRVNKIFNGWYFKQILIANKIATSIDNNIPALNDLNIICLMNILIFHGRRRYFDRVITLISFLFFYLFKRDKNILF